LIEQFLIGVWCGANRFEHMEVTRHDEAIRQIFGYERMQGIRHLYGILVSSHRDKPAGVWEVVSVVL